MKRSTHQDFIFSNQLIFYAADNASRKSFAQALILQSLSFDVFEGFHTRNIIIDATYLPLFRHSSSLNAKKYCLSSQFIQLYSFLHDYSSANRSISNVSLRMNLEWLNLLYFSGFFLAYQTKKVNSKHHSHTKWANLSLAQRPFIFLPTLFFEPFTNPIISPSCISSIIPI